MTQRGALLLYALVLLIICPRDVDARRLPIQVYTTAQGLPRNSAQCLVPDRNGLLWLCTSEGLVRFDGSEFRTFAREQGLPSSMILDFLPARKGGYWVLTDAGACRLAAGSKVGDTCRLLAIDKLEGEFQSDSLVELPDGRIWVATERRIYKSSADGQHLQRVAPALPDEHIAAIGPAPDDRLLISTDKAVYLWDGKSYRKISDPPPTGCGFGYVYAASASDVWVVGGCSVYRVVGWEPGAHLRLKAVPFGHSVSVGRIHVRRDHSLWLTDRPGLQQWGQRPDGSFVEKEKFGPEEGLPNPWVTRLAEDSQGNLWGATEGVGVFRITDTGFRVYTGEDGLGTARISSIFESRGGDLCVTASVSGTDKRSHFHVKNGERFDRIDLAYNQRFHSWGWGWNQMALQAADGEWWLESEQGLYRYPARTHPQGLSGASPLHVYDRNSALGEDDIFRVFDDSHGDLWMSTVSPRNEMIRWQRSTGDFHHFTAAEGWPTDAVATVIREARSGVLWIGTFGEVLRFRGGRFERLSFPGISALSAIRDLYIDHAGRVWIATARNGLFRCDNPDDAVPTFRRYTAHDGLSSDSTRSITEDDFGYIYVGSVRAVDRIDPRAPIGGANIQHYNAADGLPDAEQNVAYRDHRGHLWFGSLQGLAEYDPAQPSVTSIPEVYIRRVRVRGEEVPLPWEGTRSLSLNLQSDRNQVEIEYAGIDLRSVASLRYQYRLTGVDSDWSAPTSRPSVNYANLQPGQHRFEVRAVGADGAIGNSVAALALVLEAPLWRRAWFLAIAALSLIGLVYWIYNYRVRHLLAMERLRIRIATDLHDDIGASLTQISLLSEVGRRDPTRNVLGDVAGIARDLVQEMSDIVWAVSPRHDRFDSLVHRMRHFAEDAMADGELVFDTSALPQDLPLPLEYRRPLYLVFKEAVNNVSRHARATKMTVRIGVRDGSLELAVEDNGRGFESTQYPRGEGLASIRRRIKEISGTANWDTKAGSGTRFLATVPLRPRRSLPKLGGVLNWVGRLR